MVSDGWKRSMLFEKQSSHPLSFMNRQIYIDPSSGGKALNPLHCASAPEVGALLTKLLAMREERLDAKLAAKRPDLWGHKAKWQVECLRDIPPGMTLSDLSRQLKEAGGAKRLGIAITLRTDDGQVVSDSDTLRSLLVERGWFDTGRLDEPR